MGGQPAEACLSSAAVVRAFDPGDDRDPQLLAGVCSAPVEDVLPEREELPVARSSAALT
jgi:hypothetical protein